VKLTIDTSIKYRLIVYDRKVLPPMIKR